MKEDIIREDIIAIIADKKIQWDRLRGASVLVTGATGTIGGFVVRLLAELNNLYGYDIDIIAVGRNLDKGAELKRRNGKIRFLMHDLREPFTLSERLDYIYHCAAVTTSVQMVARPVDVIETEVLGAHNILELARGNGCKGVVYTSSMEMYGQLDKEHIVETDLGFLDLTNPRSCYPQTKRMIETLCNAYTAQYELPIKIARLGMTFGAGCQLGDSRIYAQFARAILNGEDIVLHTEGKSVSSFLYLADAVKALTLLLLSDSLGTYNVAMDYMSIRAFADKIAAAYERKAIIQAPENISKLGYAGDSRLALITSKIRALGWMPAVQDVETIFKRYVDSTGTL